MASNKDALVKDYYGESNGTPPWHIDFRRNLRDFKVDQLESLEGLLGDSILSKEEEEDKWI